MATCRATRVPRHGPRREARLRGVRAMRARTPVSFSSPENAQSSSSHSRPHPSQRSRAPSGQTRTVRVDGTAPNGRGHAGHPEPLPRTSRSCSWGGSRSVRSQSVRCASLQRTSSSFFPERRPCFAASQKMRSRRAWLVMPFARNTRPSASMRWSNERSTERVFSVRSVRCHREPRLLRLRRGRHGEHEAVHVPTPRLPDELIERLDAYAEQLTEATGIEVSRADVVKRLLTKGLDAVEKPKRPKRQARCQRHRTTARPNRSEAGSWSSGLLHRGRLFHAAPCDNHAEAQPNRLPSIGHGACLA